MDVYLKKNLKADWMGEFKLIRMQKTMRGRTLRGDCPCQIIQLGKYVKEQGALLIPSVFFHLGD